jgi:lysophospholipase L1-like esterase
MTVSVGHRPATRACLLPAMRLLLATGLFSTALTVRGDNLPRLNNGENLTIAAVGTSLTASAWSTWFGRVGDWLNEKYPGKVTLVNEAIGGSISQSGIDVQVPNALAHNPDAIFIEIAFNDASTQVGISQQASRDNLQTMINSIHAWATEHHKTVDIIVQTMNNTVPENYRPDLAAYYQGYRDVAAANHLLLIDHYPTWLNLYNSQADHATWSSYVPDTGHPNDLGAQKIIVPEIQQALLSQVLKPSCAALLIAGACAAGICRGWRRRDLTPVCFRNIKVKTLPSQ